MNHLAKWLIPIATVFFASGAFSTEKKARRSKQALSAQQLQGTWSATWQADGGTQSTSNWLKMLALDNDHLKVEYVGYYKYIDPSGEWSVNNGVAIGTASIEKGSVSFEPVSASDTWGCKIIMVMKGRKLLVTQQNECGFGSRVHADGTYQQESTEWHEFEEAFWEGR